MSPVSNATDSTETNNGGSTLATGGQSAGSFVDGPQSPLSDSDQSTDISLLNNLTNSVPIDPITGYPKCPPGQSRVAWPITFEWEPIPSGSNNYSRMSKCGCWLSYGLGLADILEKALTLLGLPGLIAVVDNIFAMVTKSQGIGAAGRVSSASKQIFKNLKTAANWPKYWDDLIEAANKSIYNILKRVSDIDNIEIPRAITNITNSRTNLQSRIRNRDAIEIGLDKARDSFNNQAISLGEFENTVRDTFGLGFDADITDILSDPENFDLEVQFRALRNAMLRTRNTILALEHDLEEAVQEVDFWTQKLTEFINQHDSLVYDKSQLLLSKYNLELEKQNHLKNKAKQLQDLEIEAHNNALDNELSSGGVMLNLGLALTWLGASLSFISGELFREMTADDCRGTNVEFDATTCQCKCIENHRLCKSTSDAVQDILFGVLSIDTEEETRFCVEDCCGGQVTYEFGVLAPGCGCACLGDITFGEVLSTNGSASPDDTWLTGQGCECSKPGLFNTKGKCVSQFAIDRNTALGQIWDGYKCGFYCPTITGDGENCGNFYGRRKKITWTDSQGDTYTDYSLCDCECVKPDDFVGDWPPSCLDNYVWDGSPTVCGCVPCPNREFYCLSSGTVDNCDNCPSGDEVNCDGTGCDVLFIFQQSDIVINTPTEQDCIDAFGMPPMAGWIGGFRCI